MADFPQRFLVVRLSSIGDIVHTLPAVAALGEALPQAEICWAVEACHACLLEGNPFVHRVVKLDTLGWRRNFKFSETLEEVLRSLIALREVSFQAAIDFQGLYKSALIAWLSRSQERVGFAENCLREPGVGVFYTEHVTPRACQHVVEMCLALVERLGARRLAPAQWKFPLPRSESDDRYIDQQLALLDAPEFIVINPGGGWKRKRWAPENYAELIRRLETELPCKFLFTGSPGEEDLIRTILQAARAERAKYIPSTLIQLIAVAQRARLFVGGDTGPTHLAAAVGTPLVAIYDASDPLNTPERNGPFCAADIVVVSRARVNQAPKGRNTSYLQGVSVDSVVAAIHERWARAYG